MTIINNALSGALAAQLSLAASSHNIANLQTKGYTRQSALLMAVGPDASGRSAGNGVQVTSLLRFSDNYKTQAMWRANSEQGVYSQSQQYLTQLESVMGDTSASLSAGIDDFFKAVNAVAGDPGSTPLRQQVLTAAGLMGERFNGLNNVFNTQLTSVRQQRSALVDSANVDIATIARLNKQIIETQASGVSASSLIDARDQAIDDLSNKMGVEVSDNGDGSRDVSLKSGQALVIGSMHGTLKAAPSADSPQAFSISFANSTFTLDASKMGGQLGGLTQFEQNTLIPMQKDVEALAKEIADRVNGQLQLGYNAPGAAPNGVPLFVFTPGNGSNMLKTVEGFKAQDLAFSSDGTPGDTGNLQKLAALKSASIDLPNIGSVLLSDADTQMLGKLAVDSKINKAALKTAETVRVQSINDWLSTSGVNEDEEAVKLVEFQRMYQANMQVISIANSLFDATLAMMQ
ncbi:MULTISPECIES: flagellar hook-associated protein FlgK [Massilia]|uniref:Flagellar hook-associated protein 1 n=1 Tax=Massilia aurea TaxID=373040 RepID=A0A422QRH4_9BURK|nr:MULTISPECIES: flagellar hook-associated protein FlgK [Massilia]MDY0962702.1 flagellar hook-associated protein FlgK [Massilia sp. CFBP9026]RNF32627.1 flagellar hook protein FlgK [Massilia aurea]